VISEVLVFLAFVLVTALVTWPWILHLRDAVADEGDPYAISYFLWWDYYQTFHAPFQLFDATFLFPYQSTLAFGEYNYGVSLIFFPLFFLGMRPLTVYSVASFLSFPLTGYGMFRLARTLSGSSALAWIAGIVLAFLPFRFHHLSHLPLLFFVWALLLFEALVLFTRQRTWPYAVWLGFTFLMHGLTCMTWLLLTAIPLAVSAGLLLDRERAWRDRRFWIRAGVTLGIATLLLLPFLWPVRRAAIEHGFLRSHQEVSQYSARLINWLAAEERNQVWRGLGAAAVNNEMVLFPGLLAPLLALAALLLPPRRPDEPRARDELPRSKRIIVAFLDGAAIIAGVIALLSLGYDVLKLSLFGQTILRATGPQKALAIVMLAFLVRCAIAYPEVIRGVMRGERNLRESFRSLKRSELFGHAIVWVVLGFAGSFGVNFFFHKFLYEYVPLFRGMRSATRWAMICYAGLALLAALGTCRILKRISNWHPRLKPVVYVCIVAALLFELHVAPLSMIRGAVDPDAITTDLKGRKMAGGLLELPIGDRDHIYMLRAADHRQRIVNGRNSFVPPLQLEIEGLTKTRPVPDRLLEVVEGLPVSFITLHRGLVAHEDLPWLDEFIARAVAAGRLRLIKSVPAAVAEGVNQRVELYAVVMNEPHARPEMANTSAN
jgi:uncharacterized protein YhhL (DUF1145 family)